VELKPTSDYIRDYTPYRYKSFNERLLTHLVKAGWPQ
jgi:hypothetical protein